MIRRWGRCSVVGFSTVGSLIWRLDPDRSVVKALLGGVSPSRWLVESLFGSRIFVSEVAARRWESLAVRVLVVRSWAVGSFGGGVLAWLEVRVLNGRWDV